LLAKHSATVDAVQGRLKDISASNTNTIDSATKNRSAAGVGNSTGPELPALFHEVSLTSYLACWLGVATMAALQMIATTQ
jgi:hypothetical protein